MPGDLSTFYKVDLVEDQHLGQLDVGQTLQNILDRLSHPLAGCQQSCRCNLHPLAPPHAVFTMAGLKDVAWGAKIPGVSTKITCLLSLSEMPRMSGARGLHLVGHDRHLGAGQSGSQGSTCPHWGAPIRAT